MDHFMEQIFTKMIPCRGVRILKTLPCLAARPCTAKYISTPFPFLGTTPPDCSGCKVRGLHHCTTTRSITKKQTRRVKHLTICQPPNWFQLRSHVPYVRILGFDHDNSFDRLITYYMQTKVPNFVLSVNQGKQR